MLYSLHYVQVHFILNKEKRAKILKECHKDPTSAWTFGDKENSLSCDGKVHVTKSGQGC